MKTGRRDWTGNSQAAFVTFGAEGHATHERAEHDYYATEPPGSLHVERGTYRMCCRSMGMRLSVRISLTVDLVTAGWISCLALPLLRMRPVISLQILRTNIRRSLRKKHLNSWQMVGRLLCSSN